MKQYVLRYFLVIAFIWNCILCQAQDFPRDTSFNLADDYRKTVKKHPYIQPVPVADQDIHIIENIPYPSQSERQLHLDLYHPKKKDTDVPTIVMAHGGGWRSGSKEMMGGFASHLAQLGYAVVVPEYRLSLEAMYPAGIHDLQAALEWCYHSGGEYGFDRNRLVVLGTSSGAQMASLLGNNIGNQYTVSATVNIDGILAFHHPESEEGTLASQWLGGTYEEIPDVWREASALYHVNPSTAPILFIGSSMPRFQAGRSDMIAKLSELGIYSKVHIFDDAPHTFWFYEPWFTPMLGGIKAFLERVLGE